MHRFVKPGITAGILLVGAIGVALIVWLRPVAVPEAPPPRTPVVRVVSVEPAPLDFVVVAHGTVVPRRDGELVPQVSGNVEWISPALASGGFFDAGDVLVRIDRADYEVALESARAAVARAESENRRAQREWERQKRLADRSVSSETNLDEAANAARVAEASLREARARNEQAERDLARTELTAPYVGRVRSAGIDVGQFVSRGTPIARIYSVDIAEVRLPVPDSELGYLDLPMLDLPKGVEPTGDTSTPTRPEPDLVAGPPAGPPVRLHAQFAGREQTWEGRITRTEGEIDPRSRMVHVIAEVSDPYGRELSSAARADHVALAVGLFVEAEIVGRHVDSAVELPRSALRNGDSVLVVDGESRISTRPVELLRVESDRVVIGGGLARGDRVVVTPMRVAVEGMEVRPIEVESTGLSATGEARRETSS